MNKRFYFNNSRITFVPQGSQVSENETINFYQANLSKGRNFRSLLGNFSTLPLNVEVMLNEMSFEELLEEAKKEFFYIEAAGGYIQNGNTYLFIHRHGRWDLPKGKLEKGEQSHEAAIRECEEECGVKNLVITGKLCSTFHIYPYKGDLALKQSFWYRMKTDYKGPLHPQTGESIDEARWFEAPVIKSLVLPDTYLTIRDVVLEGMNWQAGDVDTSTKP